MKSTEKVLMKKENLNEDIINCALQTLTGKWKLKIIWEISSRGSARFNELERSLEGISSLVLTRRLKELVDYKIVERKQFNEIPPHVEYSITELGQSLCPILHMLEELGKEIEGEKDKKIAIS